MDVVDGATDAVVDVAPAGNNPYGLAVNAISNLIFAANLGDDSVSIIDGTTDVVTQTLSVGTGPQGVGFNPATLTAYVANRGSGTVSVIAAFDGSPAESNCHGKSVSALARRYGGLNAAAAAFGFPSVQALQNAVTAYCGR